MNEEKKRMTVEDPASPEVLAEFQGIHEARMALADKNMMLDREKVRILSASNKLDQQQQRLFETILVDRGLPPDTLAELDSRTGKLILIKDPEKAEPTA